MPFYYVLPSTVLSRIGDSFKVMFNPCSYKYDCIFFLLMKLYLCFKIIISYCFLM